MALATAIIRRVVMVVVFGRYRRSKLQSQGNLEFFTSNFIEQALSVNKYVRLRDDLYLLRCASARVAATRVLYGFLERS